MRGAPGGEEAAPGPFRANGAASGPSLAEHLRGKKHQRLQSLRAERRAQEQRSLFVSGFARGTAAEELAAYFGAFGEVVAVVMDKEKVPGTGKGHRELGEGTGNGEGAPGTGRGHWEWGRGTGMGHRERVGSSRDWERAPGTGMGKGHWEQGGGSGRGQL